MSAGYTIEYVDSWIDGLLKCPRSANRASVPAKEKRPYSVQSTRAMSMTGKRLCVMHD